MSDDEIPYGTQLISRVVKILRALPHGATSGRRLRDIAIATQLTEPTVRRILLALIREQFVSKDDTSKRYRLGPIAFELGLASGYQEKFIERCRPHVRHVAEEAGDTTTFVKRSGVEAICLVEETGTYPIHVTLGDAGSRFPLGISTGGVALLAGLDDEEIQDLLSNDQFNRTPLTREQILERIRLTREQGYVDIKDVPMRDVRGIGLLIPTASGRPTFAITVAAIQSRLSNDRVPQVLDLMREAAQRISKELQDL